MVEKLSIILEDIKFEHTLFALPFALMSTFIASAGFPSLDKLFWILVAMVGARSTAMSFNRIIDADYDRRNARTRKRALPSGRLRRKHYTIFILIAVLVFELACYQLNALAFALSPAALFILIFYSFTKRLTVFSHFFLGLALGIAPVGAWIAVTGEISLVSTVIGFSVLLWTAGFDMIYACQDIDFDREHNLFSFPRKFGISFSLGFSYFLHIIVIVGLFLLVFLAGLRYIYLIGWLMICVLLIYEHRIVKPDDLSRVNMAFFTINGAVSLLLMVFTLCDILYYGKFFV
jgi:4-hydroxybenzoate polyprenyltransferase